MKNPTQRKLSDLPGQLSPHVTSKLAGGVRQQDVKRPEGQVDILLNDGQPDHNPPANPAAGHDAGVKQISDQASVKFKAEQASYKAQLDALGLSDRQSTDKNFLKSMESTIKVREQIYEQSALVRGVTDPSSFTKDLLEKVPGLKQALVSADTIGKDPSVATKLIGEQLKWLKYQLDRASAAGVDAKSVNEIMAAHVGTFKDIIDWANPGGKNASGMAQQIVDQALVKYKVNPQPDAPVTGTKDASAVKPDGDQAKGTKSSSSGLTDQQVKDQAILKFKSDQANYKAQLDALGLSDRQSTDKNFLKSMESTIKVREQIYEQSALVRGVTDPSSFTKDLLEKVPGLKQALVSADTIGKDPSVATKLIGEQLKWLKYQLDRASAAGVDAKSVNEIMAAHVGTFKDIIDWANPGGKNASGMAQQIVDQALVKYKFNPQPDAPVTGAKDASAVKPDGDQAKGTKSSSGGLTDQQIKDQAILKFKSDQANYKAELDALGLSDRQSTDKNFLKSMESTIKLREQIYAQSMLVRGVTDPSSFMKDLLEQVPGLKPALLSADTIGKDPSVATKLIGEQLKWLKYQLDRASAAGVDAKSVAEIMAAHVGTFKDIIDWANPGGKNASGMAQQIVDQALVKYKFNPQPDAPVPGTKDASAVKPAGDQAIGSKHTSSKMTEEQEQFLILKYNKADIMAKVYAQDNPSAPKLDSAAIVKRMFEQVPGLKQLIDQGTVGNKAKTTTTTFICEELHWANYELNKAIAAGGMDAKALAEAKAHHVEAVRDILNWANPGGKDASGMAKQLVEQALQALNPAQDGPGKSKPTIPTVSNSKDPAGGKAAGSPDSKPKTNVTGASMPGHDPGGKPLDGSAKPSGNPVGDKRPGAPGDAGSKPKVNDKANDKANDKDGAARSGTATTQSWLEWLGWGAKDRSNSAPDKPSTVGEKKPADGEKKPAGSENKPAGGANKAADGDKKPGDASKAADTKPRSQSVGDKPAGSGDPHADTKPRSATVPEKPVVTVSIVGAPQVKAQDPQVKAEKNPAVIPAKPMNDQIKDKAAQLPGVMIKQAAAGAFATHSTIAQDDAIAKGSFTSSGQIKLDDGVKPKSVTTLDKSSPGTLVTTTTQEGWYGGAYAGTLAYASKDKLGAGVVVATGYEGGWTSRTIVKEDRFGALQTVTESWADATFSVGGSASAAGNTSGGEMKVKIQAEINASKGIKVTTTDPETGVTVTKSGVLSIGASANAEARASITWERISVKVGASAGAHASATVETSSIGKSGGVGVGGSATLSATAKAEASADVSWNPVDGYSFKPTVNADVDFGVALGLSPKLASAVSTLVAGGDVVFGRLGAHADVDFGYKDGKFTAGIDIGGALVVGWDVKLKLEIDTAKWSKNINYNYQTFYPTGSDGGSFNHSNPGAAAGLAIFSMFKAAPEPTKAAAVQLGHWNPPSTDVKTGIYIAYGTNPGGAFKVPTQEDKMAFYAEALVKYASHQEAAKKMNEIKARATHRADGTWLAKAEDATAIMRWGYSFLDRSGGDEKSYSFTPGKSPIQDLNDRIAKDFPGSKDPQLKNIELTFKKLPDDFGEAFKLKKDGAGKQVPDLTSAFAIFGGISLIQHLSIKAFDKVSGMKYNEMKSHLASSSSNYLTDEAKVKLEKMWADTLQAKVYGKTSQADAKALVEAVAAGMPEAAKAKLVDNWVAAANAGLLPNPYDMKKDPSKQPESSFWETARLTFIAKDASQQLKDSSQQGVFDNQAFKFTNDLYPTADVKQIWKPTGSEGHYNFQNAHDADFKLIPKKQMNVGDKMGTVTLVNFKSIPFADDNLHLIDISAAKQKTIGINDLVYQHTLNQMDKYSSPEAVYQFLNGPKGSYIANDGVSRLNLFQTWYDKHKGGEWSTAKDPDAVKAREWWERNGPMFSAHSTNKPFF